MRLIYHVLSASSQSQRHMLGMLAWPKTFKACVVALNHAVSFASATEAATNYTPASLCRAGTLEPVFECVQLMPNVLLQGWSAQSDEIASPISRHAAASPPSQQYTSMWPSCLFHMLALSFAVCCCRCIKPNPSHS